MVRLPLVLTFIAGFTDAATFIAADKLFSAHVTGNFIVLAYDLLQGADRSAYIKLLTFPVFVAAAMLAAAFDRGKRPMRLLRLEGALLLLAAGVSWLFHWTFPAAMVIVAAMAVENAFNRLYPGLTWSVTTVMTGNTTTGALSFIQGFFAWLVWGFVHIMSLAGFTNKGIIFFSWAINYFTKNSDNRLIVRYFDTETRMTDPESR